MISVLQQSPHVLADVARSTCGAVRGSGLAVDDPRDVRHVVFVADQARDLGRPFALFGGRGDGLPEGGTRPLVGGLCSAEGPDGVSKPGFYGALGVAHVIHGRTPMHVRHLMTSIQTPDHEVTS